MTAPEPGNIDRRELLPQLFPNPDEWLFVSGLAGASKDAAALTNDGANIYTMAGAMGAAVSMGLGMALSAPNKNVAAINGDGEMLMGIGSSHALCSDSGPLEALQNHISIPEPNATKQRFSAPW